MFEAGEREPTRNHGNINRGRTCAASRSVGNGFPSSRCTQGESGCARPDGDNAPGGGGQTGSTWPQSKSSPILSFGKQELAQDMLAVAELS